MRDKHILISGGAGFIGSHLCDRFISMNYKVTAVDNLVTGSFKNIEHLLANPRFAFINQDITIPLNIDENIDFILHFASPASPIDYLKIPIETLLVSSLGTRNLLDLAVNKSSRILVASTSEVYGDPLVHPQREDYWGNVNPVGPRSCYDEAKRFMEALTMAYRRDKGLDTRIVRIFNTYGPRMRLNDGRALPTFIRQTLKNEPVSLFGDGSQTRSFCFVDDLVEGIYLLLMSDYCEPVNIGNDDEITLLDFAKEIISLTESDSEIVNLPLPKDDPQLRRPDISTAKRVLSWEPKINRGEGLKLTLDYFTNLPKAEFNKDPRVFNNSND